MKRLFGLIGLVYLSVLIIVFYCHNDILNYAIFGASMLSVAVGITLFLIKKYKKTGVFKNVYPNLIVAGITAIAACFAIILYQHIIYQPAIDNYSGKEIKISGYICDEVIRDTDSLTCTIKTYTIDGKEEQQKINIVSYADLSIEPFDKINATMLVTQTDSNSLISKGIFFKSYTDESFTLVPTGEKHFCLYSLAVKARMAMKSSLDCLLPEDYSSLCKAVLLGDKLALPKNINNDFKNTGTSFLIVVSGMHLAIVTGFALFLIKKITRNRVIRFFSVLITAIAFMMLTGFAPSIVRAGIMAVISYGATVFLRRADTLNSMGIAVLTLTLPNPLIVGDVGMLLSFAATLGIVLWAEKICGCIMSLFRFKRKFAVRFVKFWVNLFSVSLAASIWVLPISIVVFHRFSPFTAIISLFAVPLVSVLIVCALLASVLYLIPFISFLAYPFALVTGLISKSTLWIIDFFASVPYSSVNTNKAYFYIWLAVSVVLVIAGYAIKAKSFYIKCAVTFSLAMLMCGWAIFEFITIDNAIVTVYGADSGVTAAVSNGSSITLISCGGSKNRAEYITDDIDSNYVAIDNIIIPSQKNKYSSLQSIFINEFDVESVLVYDNDRERQKLIGSYDGKLRSVFGDNVHFTLNIFDNVTDDIINVDGVTYQYISGEKSMLFVPGGGKIADLPTNFRTADYLLLGGNISGIDLAGFDTIILAGDEKQYEKVYNDIEELKRNRDIDILQVKYQNAEISLMD